MLRGVEQMTFDGVSARAALEDPAAPDPRTEQYYECWGSRAMYADGWKAVTNHVNQLTAAERDAIDGQRRLRHRRVAALRHDHRPHRAPRPRRRAPRSAGRPDRAMERRRRAQPGAPARRQPGPPHRPDPPARGCASRAATTCDPATRCTRSTARSSSAGSGWWRRSPRASLADDARRPVRAGRLVGRLGLVPRRREPHLAAGLGGREHRITAPIEPGATVAARRRVAAGRAAGST